MAIWSPVSDTLFYGQGGDVWMWTPGSEPRRYLSGVKWFVLTISADGRYLAYSVLSPGSPVNSYLVDLVQRGTPKLLSNGRVLPLFLTGALLWRGDCGPNPDTPPVPQIYDLSDSSESPSVIDHVWAMWPATSSSY